MVDFAYLPRSLESLILTANSVTVKSMSTLEKVTSLKKFVVMDSLIRRKTCKISKDEIEM